MVQAKVASSWLAQILMDDSGGSTAFTSGFTQIKKKEKFAPMRSGWRHFGFF